MKNNSSRIKPNQKFKVFCVNNTGNPTVTHILLCYNITFQILTG